MKVVVMMICLFAVLLRYFDVIIQQLLSVRCI